VVAARGPPLLSCVDIQDNHSTYHRGQVASKLKRLGAEQPATDFVFWAVEQTPQPA
jgi:hypothetical protein